MGISIYRAVWYLYTAVYLCVCVCMCVSVHFNQIRFLNQNCLTKCVISFQWTLALLPYWIHFIICNLFYVCCNQCICSFRYCKQYIPWYCPQLQQSIMTCYIELPSTTAGNSRCPLNQVKQYAKHSYAQLKWSRKLWP